MTKPSADEEVPGWVVPDGVSRHVLMRTCIGCQQTDNHPKMIMASVGAPSAEIYWHHDCYVIAKAPGWEDIAAAIEGSDGATGHELRLHMMRQAGTLPEGVE